MATQDELKRQAAFRAAEAGFAVQRIAARIEAGELRNIVGIPSSVGTESLARELAIPLTDFEHRQQIDINIDGADEVDQDLNLIKGGGGALLREKVVAQASRRNIIIVDETKMSPRLGTNWPVPVEVIAFARKVEEKFIVSLGASVTTRSLEDGSYFRTDQKNLILDADFGQIADPAQLAALLGGRAGIVEHGLFLGLASDVIVAGAGGVRHLKRKLS
ncbi:MAG: ribose-5-phosphate isomerase RpiA [Desulfobacterales bacterium]